MRAEVTKGVAGERRFIIEVVGIYHLCIVQETDFLVDSIDDLLSDISLLQEPDHPCWTITLDAEALEKLKARFSIQLHVPEGCFGVLRPSLWLDLLPYKTHTGRELLMMLEKAKPLAVFHGAQLQPPENEAFAELEFDTHVSSGLFVKHEYQQIDAFDPDSNGLKGRTVLYALKKQSWRINAYILLTVTGRKVGWCDALERIEGSLLGYNDSEADAYFSLLDKTPGARLWKKH